MSAAVPTLSLLEARILGVLVEKQHTVPDIYPLSLNALTAGCNQKTSRDPVLHASESEVQAGIDRLRGDSLVVESSGGRVMRYAHNVERVLALPSQAVALLATMMLRGPQTIGELRINSDRLHRFADGSAVEGFPARAKIAGCTCCPGLPPTCPRTSIRPRRRRVTTRCGRKSPRSSEASASSVTRSNR
jgi:uncharacterized protein YceH (UPF0502 family)